MSILLPCTDSYLRAHVSQKNTKKTGHRDYLDPVIEEDLADLIEAEINFLMTIEKFKRDFEDLPDFDIQKGFNLMCMLGENNAFINEITLKQYMRTMGHQPKMAEIQAILRRLDLDGDNQIGTEEFAEAFTPLDYNPPKI
jgi:hypothetical protein